MTSTDLEIFLPNPNFFLGEGSFRTVSAIPFAEADDARGLARDRERFDPESPITSEEIAITEIGRIVAPDEGRHIEINGQLQLTDPNCFDRNDFLRNCTMVHSKSFEVFVYCIPSSRQ